MLGNTKVFSSFSVDNLDTAKDFYTKTLGQKVVDDPMGFITLKLVHEHNVMVYPKDDHTPATFTVLNFLVDDIEKTVDALIAKGVKFEQYKEFETNEKGISGDPSGPQMAWFKDPAGNVLSVCQDNR